MQRKYNICVIGATGSVGSQMLKILVERKFPFAKIHALASDRSESTVLKVAGLELKLGKIMNFDFKDVDIVFLATESEVSRDIVNHIKSVGNCFIIDNSSYFRIKKDVPLVIPEVNPEALDNIKKTCVISNPNCSTIQMVMALKPIHDLFEIKRVIVSTYQAVSGIGKSGEDELKSQIFSCAKDKDSISKVFSRQILCNVIPQIDIFVDDGSTKEEQKMLQETKKILDQNVLVHANCARVGVANAHSEYVNIETVRPLDLNKAKEAIRSFPGVKLEDDNRRYQTAIDISGRDEVFVSRLRHDYTSNNSLSFWCVADNLRKGAALNAVQIAETIISKALL